MSGPWMRLRLFVPTRVVLDEPARKVVAEASNGWFCLLPRHAGFVASLVPGVLAFVDAGGAERFVGIDEGTLVKCGREVRVATHKAVLGEGLAALREVVAREFRQADERERAARVALARLEAGVVRRFAELEETGT